MDAFETYPDDHISLVLRKLGVAQPPERIWQQPYEHRGKAYKRLCAVKDTQPDGADLRDYLKDLIYERTPIQGDLFRYLLPLLLWAWRQVLFGRAPRDYAAFEEYFLPSLIEHRPVNTFLATDEVEIVEDFMRYSILARIDEERSLHHCGHFDPVYRWFAALYSFGVLFAGVHKLWPGWWNVSTEGHAVGVLEYISCLMYPEGQNPIFDPSSYEEGGGPPSLNSPGCFMHEGGWLSENIEFIESKLSVSYVEHTLRLAVNRLLPYPSYSTVCTKLLKDWPELRHIVENRVRQLPRLLSNIEFDDWFVCQSDT